MFEDIMKTFRNRLQMEGWVRAGVAGLFTGFSAMFLSALIFWLTAVEQFWLAIIVFAVVALATTPLYYFAKYKPSNREIAARVDTLGLEERILTMEQLNGDTSYIAKKQREDAIRSLSSVSTRAAISRFDGLYFAK